MLLSLNWLRDYLQKPDLKIDPKQLAEDLTMRGLAVSAVRRPSRSLESVLVARIEKIEKHPNADRLQVTQVITSDGGTPLQIVCGAKNIAVGDIVPVALPGTILPGDFEIKVSTIRGVESSGMICSGKELGVSEDADGILQLPKHSQIGQPLSRLLGGETDDIIFEFELTPNRGDCLSTYGLGREIAPLLDTKLREHKPARFKVTPHRTSSIIKVETDDTSLCPRYVARVIDGLKVGESPDWMKARLNAVNLRPINNIVDVTNFVMWELGQPLHAFDLRKLQSGTVRVGTCQAPLDFTLLSGQTVQVIPGDILILDGDRPIALAGIMGGLNSQIEADTTSIILESAAFPAEQIRRTARRLGLSSESSKRFEKGTDLAAVALASERAASLLRDSFNANVYHPPIDTNEFGVKESIIALDMRDVRRISGMKDLSAEHASELLESVGIPSLRKSVNVLSVRLPTFRFDIKESVDLIEEIVRLKGYDAIPQNLPLSSSAYMRIDEGLFDFEWRTRHTLCALGLQETVNYSFVSEDALRKFGFDASQAVHLKNPISEELKVMRTSLLPSLLQTYDFNRKRKIDSQKIFEIARVYHPDSTSETGVSETLNLAILVSGNLDAPHWKAPGTPVDFYHLKGICESLLAELTTIYFGYDTLKGNKLLHPHRSAVLKLGLKEVGILGEVHPFIRSHVFGTTEPILLMEISLEALRRYEKHSVKYRNPSKFPSVDMDLALVVESSVGSFALSETIKHMGGTLLKDVALFDVYEGKNLPEGKKSLAFHLSFLSNDRTLNDEEINVLKERIIQGLADRHGAQLRA